MKDDQRIFKFTKDGAEVEIYIKNLSLDETEKADSVRLRAYRQALSDGAILSERLNAFLIEQGVWSIEQEEKEDELNKELLESLRILKRGGIYKKEAKKIALKIKNLRLELQALKFVRVKYINETVEGIAANKEFGFKVSQATVYNNDRNKKYFDSYEDYLGRINDVDAFLISRYCANVFYNISDEAYWPENEFLTKHGYVDAQLRLVNKDGHFVDEQDRLTDEWGNLVKVVDGKDVYIDEEGNEITETVAEPQPFLEDPEEEVPAV